MEVKPVYTEVQLTEHYHKLLGMGYTIYESGEAWLLSEEMFVEHGLRGDPVDLVRVRSDGTRFESFGTVIGRFDTGMELV